MNDPTRERLASMIELGLSRRDDASKIADDILAGLFQRNGWAEPGETLVDIYDKLGEFCTDYSSDAGEQIVEVMPVYVARPMWGVVVEYGVGGDHSHYDVSLHDTREAANAQHAKNEAEIEAEFKRNAVEATA